jgi:hypothetical protein
LLSKFASKACQKINRNVSHDSFDSIYNSLSTHSSTTLSSTTKDILFALFFFPEIKDQHTS